MSFKTNTLVVLLLSAMTLVSCKEKRPSAKDVDTFMESLTLRMDLSKHSYDNYINSIPQQHDIISRGMTVTLFDLMVKQIGEERTKIDACKTFEADEFTKEKSIALKASATDIIDAFLDGGKQEIGQVKTLVSQGQTISSPDVIRLIDQFEARMKTKYEAFGKLQKELAQAYDITVY